MRKGAKKKVTHNIGLYLGEQRLVKEGTVTSISGLFIYLFKYSDPINIFFPQIFTMQIKCILHIIQIQLVKISLYKKGTESGR